MQRTTRQVILKIHLYLGLVAAIFLLILSATGSVIAFEHDIERWFKPKLWVVTPAVHQLSEDELIRIAERAYGPAHVVSVQMPSRPDVVHVLQMSDSSGVYINPWNGEIRGRTVGQTGMQRWIGYLHQLHLRLVPNPQAMPSLAAPGKLVVSYAGLLLCFLVPTGVILWWRTKTGSIRRSSPWFRIGFDIHRAVGIYSAAFLFVSAFTGIMVGFGVAEKAIYAVMHSPEPNRMRPPKAEDSNGRPLISVDQIILAARSAIPGSSVMSLRMPSSPQAVFTVYLRSPADFSVDGAVPIPIYVDPYSGHPVQVQDLFAESPGYRMVRLNRAIHTGDYFGLPGNIVMSLSSLVLGVMVITGVIIRLKKLAG